MTTPTTTRPPMPVQTDASPDNIWKDAPIIHQYTRAEAIDDGFLVDLNQWIPIPESGYRYPVAATAAVFATIEKAVTNPRQLNDYRGVIWDILHMSRNYKIRTWENGCIFRVKIRGAGHKQIFTFKLLVTGGDNAEPVITISLPDED